MPAGVTLPEELSLVLVSALAWLLVLSSVAKIVHRASARHVMIRLGIGEQPARALTVALIAVEWLLAAALLMWPTSLYTRLGVLLLFVSFATAGLYALSSRQQIVCGCFGAIYATRLGVTQLIQLPLVTLILSASTNWPSSWNATSALTVLFVVHVVAALALLSWSTTLWRNVRSQRISLTNASRSGMHPATRSE